MWRHAGVVALAVLVCGCGLFGSRRPAPIQPQAGASQTGVASWYGPGFHGNPTSSGEIYDQDDLTAAHPSLPLGSRVAVTNLQNGRSVEVRVNDRGPFVAGRVIDLSRAAARHLGMIGPGTAPVRIEVLDSASAQMEAAAFTVQVGAFSDRDNAQRLRAALDKRFDQVRIATLETGSGRYYRVRVGRFAHRADAVALAQSVTSLGLSAVIVEDGVAP
ncbi:MAG: septal ring lytic transglycosylase RlpA family protein [Deltaproteobacteria bacterium]|nr:septal ring lytic transglycosylase RlpA family protein [Deltaproteobacteria bacterium]